MHLRHFESHFSRLLVALCRHKVWTIGHCLKKLEPTNSAIGPLLREGIGQVIARGNPTQIAVDAVDVVAQLKSLRAARIFESPSHGLSLTSMALWPPSEPAQRIPATNACSSAAATRSARRSDRARPTTMKFTPERCWSSSPQLPRCFRLRIFAADCFSFQYQTSPSKQIHEDNLARVDIRSSSYSQSSPVESPCRRLEWDWSSKELPGNQTACTSQRSRVPRLQCYQARFQGFGRLQDSTVQVSRVARLKISRVPRCQSSRLVRILVWFINNEMISETRSKRKTR